MLFCFGYFGLTGANGIRQQQEPPYHSPYVPDEYQLVFFDELESDGLDPSHWQHRYREGFEYGAGIASYSSISQPGNGLIHLVTVSAS